MSPYLLLPLVPVGHALFGVIVRYAQRRGSRALFVGATNYVVAALINLGLALRQGALVPSTATWQLALPAGLIYALTFRTIATSMHRRGLAVPSAVVQLAVIVPLGCAIFLWGERPDGLQIVGIILALAALTLLAGDATPAAGSPPVAKPGTTGLLTLLLLFLLQGGAGLAPKAFSELGPAGEGYTFLTLLFATAALTFLPEWLGPVRPRRQDLLWGGALGVTNAAANLLSIYVLQRLPGILVFPIMTAGALVLTSALGLVVWREPLGRWGRAGMLVALGAVVLVGLGG